MLFSSCESTMSGVDLIKRRPYPLPFRTRSTRLVHLSFLGYMTAVPPRGHGSTTMWGWCHPVQK